MLWPSIFTGGAVISGLVFIWSTYAGTQTQRYIFKPLTTILILGIALTLPDPISSFYRLMVAIGMLFSLGGDIFLMLPGNTFVFGLVSFLVAHLFYIVAYQSRAGLRFTLWLFVLYALFFGAMLYLLWPHVGALRLPVVIYALVLVMMGWQAAEQWWVLRDGSALLAMVGALLFMLSDATLALNKFRAPIPQHDLIIMSTYYGAQLLIAWSVQRIP
jgi:uncharacterized membrane protein YhhN